jgi:ankyrin repeat protein
MDMEKLLGRPSAIVRKEGLSLLNKNLALAIAEGKCKRALHLISMGAQLHVAARPGSTPTPELLPLFRAVMTGSVEMAELLIDAGAEVQQKTDNGLTALHWAASGSVVGHCALLIERGADIEAPDEFGNVPLHYAARDEEFGAVALLIDKGAALDRRDNNGNNALQHAAAMDRVENMRELIKLGLVLNDAPFPLPNQYLTPFQTAVKEGAENVARFLIDEHGERHDQKTRAGVAMLDLAGSDEVRSLLLSYETADALDDALDFAGAPHARSSMSDFTL